MIGNELETEIIDIYRKDITRLLSINQIAKEIGKKYPYIHKKVTNFIEQGILKATKIGNSNLCSINLKNEEAIILLSITELTKRKELLKKQAKLKEEIQKIKEKQALIETSLFINNSILIITKNKKDANKLEKEINIKNSKIKTTNELQTFLKEKYPETKNKIILYKNENYYELIKDVELEIRQKNSIII